MSKSSSSRPSRKQPPPPQTSSSLPGIISAVVVLIVLGLIATLLFTRSGDQSAAATPTTGAEAFASTIAEQSEPTFTPGPTQTPIPTRADITPQPTAAARSFSQPPPMTIDPAKKYTATLTTPRGDVVIELLPDIAPQTVNSFVFLARQNFYNGLTWHRVLPGFMAQGGDPLGDGTGGPGYNVPGEFTNQISFDKPGIVAMARAADPDSAGSQFFITTANASFLDGNYTIFGRVISGQEFVDSIPLRDPENPADLATPGETILGITISEQ